MQIDFDDAGRQATSSAATRSLVIAPDQASPKTASAVTNPAPRTRRRSHSGPRRHDAAEPAPRAGIDRGDCSPGLERNAQRPHAVAPADCDDRRAAIDRMELKMPVTVDVIERQPGCPIGFELRGDLSFDLPLDRGIEGDLRAVERQVVAEMSRCRRADREPRRRGLTGVPSVSTTCSPTRRFGNRRARATASATAAAPTMRLVALRMPRRCASSMAALTGSLRPKSSAVMMSLFRARAPGAGAAKEKNSTPSRSRRTA